jgi:hypothetical protein
MYTHTHNTVDLALDVHYAEVLPSLPPYLHGLAVGEDIVISIHFAVPGGTCGMTVGGQKSEP